MSVQVSLTKFELDLLILALERSATRFEAQARMSLKRESLHKQKEHDETAANQRRLMHRLLSLRQEIHRAEQQQWTKVLQRAPWSK